MYTVVIITTCGQGNRTDPALNVTLRSYMKHQRLTFQMFDWDLGGDDMSGEATLDLSLELRNAQTLDRAFGNFTAPEPWVQGEGDSPYWTDFAARYRTAEAAVLKSRQGGSSSRRQSSRHRDAQSRRGA